MPGEKYILTYKNAPKLQTANVARGRILAEPLPRELNLQGEVVAIVVADTEDLAQDAADAIKVTYEVLPFASLLKDSMATNAPDLGHGKGNLVRHSFSPADLPHVTWADKHGDIETGFAEADVVKEFSYRFAGGVSVPMQPSGSVAKWDGDKLTMWGMGQGIYPVRATLGAALRMDGLINKWNGCTFGAARMAAERFYPMIAHLAKVTGRPVKVMLPKDQELAQLQIKPETITKFRVGAKKDGQIVALDHEVYVSVGDLDFGVHADGPGNAANQSELYTAKVPHWRSTWCAYRTNAPRPGPSRSHIQQETKWSWENMIDEMADAFAIDPVQHRMMHITQLARVMRAIRTKRCPRSKCCGKAPRRSDGRSAMPSQAASREDSSAGSASACPRIMAGTWAITRARKPSPNLRRFLGQTFLAATLTSAPMAT